MGNRSNSETGSHSRGTDWPTTRVNLLQVVCNSDEHAAWRNFVDIYGPLVFAYCRKQGLQDADAADVCQNVMMRLNRAIRSFEYSVDRGTFRSWLRTICRNEVLRHYRGRYSRGQSDQSANSPSAWDEVYDEHQWTEDFHGHIFKIALARIRPEFSEDIWRAFQMLWVEDRKVDDVVAEFGQNRNWLYKAKHRVISRLEREVLILADDIPGLHI